MIKRTLKLLGMASAMLALQSCFDKGYDLNDIDMTLSTGSDLTLPTCSTGDIQLRNIIEEGDVVKFVNDENGQKVYAVVQDGTADIQEINIPEIKIEPILTGIDATIHLDPSIGGAAPKKKVRIHVGIVDITLPDAEYGYTIKPADNAAYVIQDATADVDPVVRGLEHVVTRDPVKASVDLNVSGLPPMLGKVYLEDLSLTIPSELEISGCKFMGKDIALDKIVNGKIPLTEGKIPIDLENGQNKTPIRLDLSLTGVMVDDKFRFEPNEDPTKQGKVIVSGSFEVGGTFGVNTADINEDALTTFLTDEGMNILNDVLSDQSLRPLFERYPIHITGDANLSPIVLGKVTGDVLRDIADIQPITLDDLPDFLNDPEVFLDLENPIVLLKTFSNIPAVAKTAMTITSNFDNEAPKHVFVSPVNIPGSAAGLDSRFYIADREPTFFPTGYTKENTVALPKTGSVRELIQKIPKQLDVDVEPVALHIENVDITKPYKVGVEYQVFAPLIVGPDFKLVYSDTERDWGKDMDDFKDLDAERLELKAKVTSDLPADLVLMLVPIDRQAREITGLSVNSLTVKANANKQDIEFIIKPADPTRHTLNDFIAGKNGMPQLDGIQYKAVIQSEASGGKLYESAKIKLDDIKLTIKGGITYDAN